MNFEATQTCLVTGASGYLGSRVTAALERRGWKVMELSRHPKAGGKSFRLGDEIAPAELAGAKALVHCAYDFKALSWNEIRVVNVVGSEKLLKAAREAKVENIVNISSISAYESCRSLYGKAKLEVEGCARGVGAVSIRPGLIYGDAPEGMYGKLCGTVEKARLVPLFGGGKQIQYMVHDEDLCDLICRCAAGEVKRKEPITVANEEPWPFRNLLEELARRREKRLRFLPLPWRFVWMGIKSAEIMHVPLQFRSDSLVSLMYQNPNPDFGPQSELGVRCRAFRNAVR